jgi:hypothetical protein
MGIIAIPVTGDESGQSYWAYAPFRWQLRRDFRPGCCLTFTVSGSLSWAPGLLVSIVAVVRMDMPPDRIDSRAVQVV